MYGTCSRIQLCQNLRYSPSISGIVCSVVDCSAGSHMACQDFESPGWPEDRVRVCIVAQDPDKLEGYGK